MPKPFLTQPEPSPAIASMTLFLRKEQIRVTPTPTPKHHKTSGSTSGRITGLDEAQAVKLADVGWRRVW